ncbi:MAG TPA: hypothetical protein VF054_14220 [Micromonosporaceae bacterium]
MTRRAGHPDWCAQGHRCGLGEHRAEPLTVAVPGAGSVVLTRVQDATGRGHAEVWMRIDLPTDDHDARLRLAALLTHLHTLIGPARAAHIARRAA